jgi:hypothetical protein
MWYCSRARRYFSPQGENRNALILKPRCRKAELEGAKMVPPWWWGVLDSLRVDARPVL